MRIVSLGAATLLSFFAAGCQLHCSSIAGQADEVSKAAMAALRLSGAAAFTMHDA
jgi:hypothetical protein